MKKIEQKVLKFIDEKNLISKNDIVLVALSGGPDSVFLLYFLNKFKKRFQISIGVFHLNHKLRGKNSDDDLIFCKNLSDKMKIDFLSSAKNIKQFAKENKISIEEAGRKIRYEELHRIAEKNNYNKIATAHIADDNTETVLLNLIKGTGLKGISGIPIKRGNIIRPILILTKKEILEYLHYYEIDYRVDESNLSIDYERNFLRSEVIPLIKKKLNPSLDFTIFNSSEVFKNQLGIIEVELKKNSKKIFKFEDNILKISLLELQKVKSEMWGELFKFEIGRNFPVKFKFNDLRKILSLIKNESGKKIEISNGLFAFREREELLIKKEKHDFFNEVKIKIDDEVKVDKKVLEISLSKKKMEQISRSKLIDKRTIEYISSDKIKGGFILRRWKKGDIFFPLGLNGSKKISDFLNEKKIESNKKVNQLVLTNQNKIVWVVGLRLDERFKIDKNTKKVLKLCLK